MWLQVILWLLTATLLVLQALATNCFPRPETYLVEIFFLFFIGYALRNNNYNGNMAYAYSWGCVIPHFFTLCRWYRNLLWNP